MTRDGLRRIASDGKPTHNTLICVNVGRQLGSSPSSDFASKLVRLNEPPQYFVNYCYSIHPLNIISINIFQKIRPFRIPDDLHAMHSRESRQSLTPNHSTPLPCPPLHGLWLCAGLYPSPRCSESGLPNNFAKFTPVSTPANSPCLGPSL